MNELTREQLEQLRKPFPAKAISFKCQTKPNDKGNSLVVAYIDARDVMERLDEVMGPDWSDRYEPSPAGGLACYLTVGGITRADVGDTDNANEATKSAYSDAFKRAAVKFGIGRFLYDLPKMWGKAKALGNSTVLEDGEAERLRRQVDDFLAGQPQKKQAPAASKPEPIPAEKWQHWLDLCKRADAMNIAYVALNREKINVGELKVNFDELAKYVKAAEAQAKSAGA